MDENKQQKQLDFMLANILNLGKFSYSLQEKREKILIDQSNRLLIAYLIAMAALLAPVLKMPVGLRNAVILGFVASFVLSIMAGWRFKYTPMSSIDVFFDETYNRWEEFQTQTAFDVQWKHQISAIHKSKKKNNDKRAMCILISMISFLCSIVIATILIWF